MHTHTSQEQLQRVSSMHLVVMEGVYDDEENIASTDSPLKFSNSWHASLTPNGPLRSARQCLDLATRAMRKGSGIAVADRCAATMFKSSHVRRGAERKSIGIANDGGAQASLLRFCLHRLAMPTFLVVAIPEPPTTRAAPHAGIELGRNYVLPGRL